MWLAEPFEIHQQQGLVKEAACPVVDDDCPEHPDLCLLGFQDGHLDFDLLDYGLGLWLWEVLQLVASCFQLGEVILEEG